MAEHHLSDDIVHNYWDRNVPVRLEVDPGDVVTVECAEPSNQVRPGWTSADFAGADQTAAHALSGAIAVRGAEPGDALRIDILEARHKGWGWSGHLPGVGLLAEDFDFFHLHHWELDGPRCRFADGIEVPAEPFPGVVGVAPAEPGRLSTIPPRANGGNVDVRDLVGGSTAWLPVLADGALFSIGDCHAAQGDGEVCGTAIECPMTVTIRLGLEKARGLAELQIRRTRPPDSTGEVHITTAHGPDLFGSARNATRSMVEWLTHRYGLDPSAAYLLCSTAGNLKISAVVNAPNWVVAMHFPLGVFR